MEFLSSNNFNSFSIWVSPQRLPAPLNSFKKHFQTSSDNHQNATYHAQVSEIQLYFVLLRADNLRYCGEIESI